MLAQDLISKFRLYVDDSSELSTVEELALLNKIYRRVLDVKPWEFLKKEWSQATNGATDADLPDDFMYFLENYIDGDIPFKAIFVDSSQYKIVNWSDRRLATGNYVYVDLANKKLHFSNALALGQTMKADYIYAPPDLILTSSPVIPSSFQDMLYHAMAVDDMIIQLFDKARSYAQENQSMYNSYLQGLSYWNANFIN